MELQSQEFIKRLATDVFIGQNITVDIDILFNQVKAYNLTIKEFAKYIVFISDNLDFFEYRLNYSLQASNLLLYCIDALKIPEDKWRGSYSRHIITKELQNILLTKL